MIRTTTLVLFLFIASARAGVQVTVLATPNGGIEPQAVVAKDGAVHLLYFTGDPAKGELYWVRGAPDRKDPAVFSTPLRVNDVSGTAAATGTIRGGQMALGKNGRVHVAWNGSGRAGAAGMMYSRLDDTGAAFEPARDLMQVTTDLDGGGTVAADDAGNVWVAWHGTRKTGDHDEAHRQVWIARSTDDGKSFTKEAPAWTRATGACSCCAMRAFAGDGTLWLVYRAATSTVNRDLWLLASRDGGKSFDGALLDQWKLPQCPMSAIAFAPREDGIVAAWEAEERVRFAAIDAGSTHARETAGASGAPSATKAPAEKYPSVAVDAAGNVLVAWAEGAGWQKGGDLVWQVFDAAGKPTDAKGRVANGVATWSFPAAVAVDGGFLLYH